MNPAGFLSKWTYLDLTPTGSTNSLYGKISDHPLKILHCRLLLVSVSVNALIMPKQCHHHHHVSRQQLLESGEESDHGDEDQLPINIGLFLNTQQELRLLQLLL